MTKKKTPKGRSPRTASSKKIDKIQTNRSQVEDKLERYLLNPDHEVGKHKCKYFEEALGYTKKNKQGLAEQLVFDEATANKVETTVYGTKYNQNIEIISADKKSSKKITTAWIVPKGTKTANLTTAVPAKKGKKDA